MNKLFKILVTGTAMVSVFVGAPLVFGGQNITVKGSDTVLVLGQRWAEEYMKQHPETTIQVTGGGSGVGLAALVNGTTDIANASRAIKAAEVEKANKAGFYPEEYKAALDTLAIVVNSQNPVKELTVKQLMGIYVGKINNWKEVGGNNQVIIRYSRESSSGTYQFFKEHILKNQDYAPDCQTLSGTSAVTNAVSKDPAGIGYGGAAYFLGQQALRVISVKKDDKAEAVNPVKADGKLDYDAAWSGRYPIWRYLYMYTGFKAKGAIKEYIDWIQGPDGQKLVEEVGYIPLPKK
jgi:phosphate transport system substrate-binding protein